MMPYQHLRNLYWDQPREISIETFAQCNARCTFCPYGSLGREGTQLPDDVLDSLIEQMKSWRQPFFVSPFKVNDPLLDPRMEEICRRIDREVPQARIRFFTNGSMLTPYHIGWLNQLRHLEELWISLNSTDPQEYHELMGLKWATTQRRMFNLYDCVRFGTFNHPVVVSRVASDDLQKNADFINSVLETWPVFRPVVIKRDGWLGAVTPGSSEIPKTPCGRWFELNITAQGKAVLCCMDGKGEFVLGDVSEQKLLEIYNQKHLVDRRLHVRDRQGIEPCARCTY